MKEAGSSGKLGGEKVVEHFGLKFWKEDNTR
jgi:hypothetical protein